MKLIKITIWIISSLILLVLILFFFTFSFKNYSKNYFKALNLKDVIRFSEIKEIYGEPLAIIPSENLGYIFTAEYNGIELVLMRLRDGDASLSSVRIHSSEIRFGRAEIGIGSTREEIKKAYNGRLHQMAKWLERSFFNDGRPVLNGSIINRTDGGITVIDGITWVEFHFDEDNKVFKIVITVGGP